MALWQFEIVLIPRKWAIKHDYVTTLLYDDDGYDVTVAWKDNQPCVDYVHVLSKLLPQAESWHKDLACWGDEKGHDIQVWSENGQVEGIHIRLALNQDLTGMLPKLVSIAKELDCVLFYPELELSSDADEFELEKALLKSNASRYIQEPKSSRGPR